MLFNNKIEPCCAYCRHGRRIGEDEIACVKRGIISASGSCGRFTYEPTKRVPNREIRLAASGFTEEDFAL